MRCENIPVVIYDRRLLSVEVIIDSYIDYGHSRTRVIGRIVYRYDPDCEIRS
jgi:hypothetical protein